MTKIKIIVVLTIVGVLGWALFGPTGRNEIEIKKGGIELERMNLPRSDLSGIKCERAQTRPVAVMLSSDLETRPLSGIAEADMVFEMPVTEGGVTRLMAVYQCAYPAEIGSIRSARLDFIPLVKGLGAVYAHWGGEKEALSVLNGGALDNIDAMKYEGTVYYRKAIVRPPHNGFTSFERLERAIIDLGYNLERSATVYRHRESESLGEISPPSVYEGNFLVEWRYDVSSSVYRRWRAGQPEIDRNHNRQAEASNVVIMKTSWMPVNKDYIRVKTVGSGEAIIYQNGQTTEGRWSKEGESAQLYFYDQSGKEIEFAPGVIWVEIVI